MASGKHAKNNLILALFSLPDPLILKERILNCKLFGELFSASLAKATRLVLMHNFSVFLDNLLVLNEDLKNSFFMDPREYFCSALGVTWISADVLFCVIIIDILCAPHSFLKCVPYFFLFYMRFWLLLWLFSPFFFLVFGLVIVPTVSIFKVPALPLVPAIDFFFVFCRSWYSLILPLCFFALIPFLYFSFELFFNFSKLFF